MKKGNCTEQAGAETSIVKDDFQLFMRSSREGTEQLQKSVKE